MVFQLIMKTNQTYPVPVESLVQTFIMTFLSFEEHKGNKTNFISMDKVKFKKKIVPGDVMLIEAILDSFKEESQKVLQKERWMVS